MDYLWALHRVNISSSVGDKHSYQLPLFYVFNIALNDSPIKGYSAFECVMQLQLNDVTEIIMKKYSNVSFRQYCRSLQSSQWLFEIYNKRFLVFLKWTGLYIRPDPAVDIPSISRCWNFTAWSLYHMNCFLKALKD